MVEEASSKQDSSTESDQRGEIVPINRKSLGQGGAVDREQLSRKTRHELHELHPGRKYTVLDHGGKGLEQSAQEALATSTEVEQGDALEGSEPKFGLQWVQAVAGRFRNKHDREILNLALPCALALAADPLLGLVDTAFVGRISPEALVRSPSVDLPLVSRAKPSCASCQITIGECCNLEECQEAREG